MNEDQKIILIKGGKSGWFEQAIFILKDKGQRKNMPKNFVEEAEKIINNYMAKKYSNVSKLNPVYSQAQSVNQQKEVKFNADKRRAKRKKYDKVLNISVILCCILIGLILYYFG